MRTGAASGARLPFGLVLGIVTLAAFVIRLAAVAVFQGFDAPPDFEAQPDQIEYENIAHHLAEGHGYSRAPGEPTARRPPGTPWAIAAVYSLTGRSWPAGRAWFCLLSALTCVPLAFVVRRLSGETAGLVAAAWLALTPAHFYYPLHFVSEVPYGLVLTLAVWLGVEAAGASWRGIGLGVAAGVALAAAVLTRPQAMLILPILWMGAFAAARLRVDAVYATLLAASVACVPLVAGWTARNEAVMGVATLSTNDGETFLGTHNEVTFYDEELAGAWLPASELERHGYVLPEDEAGRSRVAKAYAREFLRDHWHRLPYIELRKLGRLVSLHFATDNRTAKVLFAGAWLVTAPLMIVGLVAAFRRSPRLAFVAAAPILGLLLNTLIFHGSVRFRHSTEPIFVLFAACGVVWAARRWRRSDA